MAGNAQGQSILGNLGNAGFVGSDTQDALLYRGGQAGQQQQQQQFLNNLNQRMQSQQNRRQNTTQNGAGGNDMPQVQISLRVGFQVPPATAAAVTRDLSVRVSRILNPIVSDPNLQIVGQTVTLRGTVASEEEKRLAETILSLQPGVTTVNNELVVAGAPLPPPLAD
jgi:hypothetical protein